MSDGLNNTTGVTVDFDIAHVCNNPSHAAVTGHQDIPKGSTPEVYYICHEAQWIALANSTGAGHLDQKYMLRDDLDLSSVANPHPTIAEAADPFTGTFDGYNHKVWNWRHDSVNTTYRAPFEYISGNSVITRLHMRNIYVRGHSNSAGLVGAMAGNAVVTYSSATGEVSPRHQSGSVGGLVAVMISSTNQVLYSWTHVDITGSASSCCSGNKGGLVGNALGLVSNSFSLGKVYGQSAVGGFVGYAGASMIIRNSFSAGNVYAYQSSANSPNSVGGFVGAMGSSSLIEDCYALGNVVANEFLSNVGGFVGGISYTINAVTIRRSFATGNVRGTTNVGGFIGELQAGGSTLIEHSYATGNVTGVNNVGGFIGVMTKSVVGASGGSSIQNSYALGNVVGTGSHAGGFAGIVSASGGRPLHIRNSYARGNVNGDINVGGFVGIATRSDASVAQTSITNSYSTGNVAGTTGPVGGFAGAVTNSTLTGNVWRSGATAVSAGGTETTEANMKKMATYTGLNWDWAHNGSSIIDPNQGSLTNDYWVMKQNNTDDIDYPQSTFFYRCWDTSTLNRYSTTATYSGGGTRADPYVLCRPGHLTALMNTTSDWDSVFYQGETIDMNGLNVYKIGDDVIPFTGYFDGNNRNGFQLNNFSVNEAENHIGLFGILDGDFIYDGSADGILVDIKINAGSVTGDNGGMLIGLIADKGIVMRGFAQGGTVSESASGLIFGGLIGEVTGESVVIKSFSTASVSAATHATVGGLIGSVSDESLIRESFGGGNVTGEEYVGGLIGSLSADSFVRESMALGSVTATDFAGGLIGQHLGSSNLIQSQYSGSTLTGATVDAISAVNISGNGCSSVYWNTTATGFAGPADCGATGISAANYVLAASFTNFDFVRTWTTKVDTAAPVLIFLNNY